MLGCAPRNLEVSVIKIKGSDTMLKLVTSLAEEYMRKNPGISIYVEGGGTKTGIEALSLGQIDICTASRTLKGDEIKKISEQFGTTGISTLIARDALSIYLNYENVVRNLSLVDIKNIFTCRIKNWKNLGGVDAPIVVVSRSPNSGTYLYFKEHVLENEEFCSSNLIKSTTQEIVEYISENKNAIGYGGIGYKNKTYHSLVENIEPIEENVLNDTYPISRYLHFYTLTSKSASVKNFIDWVIGAEGQEIVQKAGYIPIWKKQF